jgi:hypothetical protein
MWNIKNLHLVPPAVQDRVAQLLTEANRPEVRDTYAQQIEVIRDYCIASLEQYAKKARRK